MNKLYAALGILAVVATGLFVWWITDVVSDRDKYKAESIYERTEKDKSIKNAESYQKNNERQAKLISEYQVELDEKKRIADTLERDIIAGRKRLQIRATCPSTTSGAPANTERPEAATISDPIVRSDIFDLKAGIIQLEANYNLCLRVLSEERKK